MEFPGYLQTVGEIGIGLVGFSGLILALRKNAGPLTDTQKYRLQILFSLSFGAMFLSFLPELLFNFGVGADVVWQCSSALLSLYSLSYLAWLFSRTIGIKKSNPEIFTWTIFWSITAIHLIVLLMQFAHIFSVLDIAGAAVYSLALIWYLMNSAYQFVRMLFVPPRSDS